MRLDAPFQLLPLPPGRETEARAPAREAVPRDDGAESTTTSRQRGAPSRGVLEALAAMNAQRRQADDLNDVPPRNRAAIAAYLDNVPGPLERLGVELAGIDVTA